MLAGVAPQFCCSKKTKTKQKPAFVSTFPSPKNRELVSHFLTQMEASILETSSIQLPNQGPVSGLCWSSVLVASVSDQLFSDLQYGRCSLIAESRWQAPCRCWCGLHSWASALCQRPHRRRQWIGSGCKLRCSCTHLITSSSSSSSSQNTPLESRDAFHLFIRPRQKQFGWCWMFFWFFFKVLIRFFSIQVRIVHMLLSSPSVARKRLYHTEWKINLRSFSICSSVHKRFLSVRRLVFFPKSSGYPGNFLMCWYVRVWKVSHRLEMPKSHCAA